MKRGVRCLLVQRCFFQLGFEGVSGNWMGKGARAGRFNAGAAGKGTEKKKARKRRKQLRREGLKESGEG